MRKSKNNDFFVTSVNTEEAVDQERQGTNTKGLGQAVAARDAIYNRYKSMN